MNQRQKESEVNQMNEAGTFLDFQSAIDEAIDEMAAEELLELWEK